jgi:hypothetical protein
MMSLKFHSIPLFIFRVRQRKHFKSVDIIDISEGADTGEGCLFLGWNLPHCGSVCDALSISDSTASNCKVINELEIIGKEGGVT